MDQKITLNRISTTIRNARNEEPITRNGVRCKQESRHINSNHQSVQYPLQSTENLLDVEEKPVTSTPDENLYRSNQSPKDIVLTQKEIARPRPTMSYTTAAIQPAIDRIAGFVQESNTINITIRELLRNRTTLTSQWNGFQRRRLEIQAGAERESQLLQFMNELKDNLTASYYRFDVVETDIYKEVRLLQELAQAGVVDLREVMAKLDHIGVHPNRRAAWVEAKKQTCYQAFTELASICQKGRRQENSWFADAKAIAETVLGRTFETSTKMDEMQTQMKRIYKKLDYLQNKPNKDSRREAAEDDRPRKTARRSESRQEEAPKRSPPIRYVHVRNFEDQNHDQCIFCGYHHEADKCGNVKTPQERLIRMKQSNRCPECTQRKTAVHRCPPTACKYCGKQRHHHTLCFEPLIRIIDYHAQSTERNTAK
ncbi:unnamed protein product [Caenorhabditis nigoni]|uniref:CCHC-type domain-containing protein n=2 Tax=Caenorhabditis nigoni TaxID=1611254 RepID=A0A2G5SCY2_9PELO|nr:hypothetical protein B9Z55_028124 [Caenorhabditis nigoni]